MIDRLLYVGDVCLSDRRIQPLSNRVVLLTPSGEPTEAFASTRSLSEEVRSLFATYDIVYLDMRSLPPGDLGMGFLQAFGVRFFGPGGEELRPSGRNLYRIRSIDLTRLARSPGKRLRLIMARPDADRREQSVSARRFGLNPLQAELLERGLFNLMRLAETTHALDFASDLHACEGGGTSGVLAAFLRRHILHYIFIEDLREDAEGYDSIEFISEKEIVKRMKEHGNDYKQKALDLHEKYRGKICVEPKSPLTSKDDLALLYTPGVAEPCKKIAESAEEMYRYTAKGNLVAVVTDGSAVLGLGNIGCRAGMPVMEGKAILFKHFGGVDAFPILIDSQDPDVIVETVKRIAPTFGGINLEDIAAPRCFEVERRLKEELSIPVFHDDQHGTAVVVTAGVINALKLTGKKPEDVRCVINGCGAAGIAILKMMRQLGITDILILDSKGIIRRGAPGNTPVKEEVAALSNRDDIEGDLKKAMQGADLFIGVSVAGAVTQDMVRSMRKDAILFAMANPVPEIYPEEAKAAGARVVGTGRSDFPNQINNVLCFPGLFRGALDARARAITDEMKMAAARAIAEIVGDKLSEDYVIPDPMNMEIPKRVAEAVKAAVHDRAYA